MTALRDPDTTLGPALTVEVLRRKAEDHSPVLWPGQAIGFVTRVARDGSWADMVWALNWPDLRDGTHTWRKRQPLSRIGDWRHA